MSEIKEYSFVENALNELREQYGAVPDASTKDGYKLCKANAKSVGKYRIDLEKKRKEIKGPALDRCKAIDSEANRIQAIISEIEEPLKLAYKAVDDERKAKEAERIESIQSRINAIEVFIDMSRNASAAEISEWIEQVDDIDPEFGFDEFSKDIAVMKNKVMSTLQNELELSVKRQVEQEKRAAEQKELEELRALKAEKDAIEAEKNRLAQEERQKEALSEQKRLADIQLKEQQAAAEKQRLIDIKEAEERAKKQEIERQKRESEAEKQRIEALEQNKRHVGAVRKEIKEQLMSICNIDEGAAKAVTLALSKINRVTINY